MAKPSFPAPATPRIADVASQTARALIRVREMLLRGARRVLDVALSDGAALSRVPGGPLINVSGT